LPIETQNSKEDFSPADNGAPQPTENDGATEERWLDLPDGRMRYLKAGSGRPLILVHGLLGYAFSWRFTIPALVPHATVYAIDNLGTGFSTAREGMDCTVRPTAERVLQFADAMGL
jgi:pimeloyl-ACP methyl ester carboxylesterase